MEQKSNDAAARDAHMERYRRSVREAWGKVEDETQAQAARYNE